MVDASTLPAGDALNALVAEKVMGEFSNPETLGYYGPPLNGPWRHELSVRYATPAEAEAAWQSYWDAEVSQAPYGKAGRDELDFHLCYWQEGWGPRLVYSYSEDDADALGAARHLVKQGWTFRLTVDHEYGAKAYFHGAKGNVNAYGDTIALAICRAALAAVERA